MYMYIFIYIYIFINIYIYVCVCVRVLVNPRVNFVFRFYRRNACWGIRAGGLTRIHLYVDALYIC